MKKNHIYKIMTAGAMAILLCVLAVMPVSAMTPASPIMGSVLGGLFVRNGKTALALEQTELVFDINELPAEEYDSAQEFLEYGASLTANYTLYNPTDQSVTVELLTPVGQQPGYARDLEKGLDAHKYTVRVDGKQVATHTRHSYTWDNSSYFGASEYLNALSANLPSYGLGYMSDTYAKHRILSPDAPVYVYTYHARIDKSAKSLSFGVAGTISADPNNTLVFATNISGYMNVEDGVMVYCYSEETFVIYAVGKDIGQIPWTCVSDEGDVLSNASVKLMSKEVSTFYDVVMRGYDSQKGVGETDYYNAFVADLDYYGADPTTVIRIGEQPGVTDYQLLEWQCFELTLSAGQRVTVTVQSPLYPFVHDYYDPSIYTYAYAMSPSEQWSRSGTVRLTVLTDQYLLKSDGATPAPQAYTQTESGFVWEGESDENYIIISTCDSQSPVDSSGFVVILFILIILLVLFVVYVLPWIVIGVLVLLILAAPAMLVGCIAVALIVLLIVLISKKSNKKKAKKPSASPEPSKEKEDAHSENQKE